MRPSPVIGTFAALIVMACAARDDEAPFASAMLSASSGAPKGTGATDNAGYDQLGLCGVRSLGTIVVGRYEAVEETYLVGDQGDGDDMCRIRFDVKSIGVPTVDCPMCEWSYVVRRSDPVIVTNIETACANSELALDATAIATADGGEAWYAYVREFLGHNDVLMIYDHDTKRWEAQNLANWNAVTGSIEFDRRDGYCGY
ncbi:MAG: hypothetical protein V3V08_25600 [Nannocystaceae bacterium]